MSKMITILLAVLVLVGMGMGTTEVGPITPIGDEINFERVFGTSVFDQPSSKAVASDSDRIVWSLFPSIGKDLLRY